LVENVINKLDAWAEKLPGNNYEAREKVFASGFMTIVEKHGLKEHDLFAFRQVLKNIRDLNLTPWEMLVAYILFVSSDDLNDMLLDQEFLLKSNRDFDDSELDKAEKVVFINECYNRIRASMYIITKCCAENELRKQSGKPEIKIMDSKVFCQIRFNKIAY
jgi:hypothetical protein